MLGIPVYQHATLKSQQNTGLLVHTCLYCYLFLIMLCSMCQGTLDSIITKPTSLAAIYTSWIIGLHHRTGGFGG